MNRVLLPIAMIAALMVSFADSVRSQTAAAPKSTLQQLQDMKARNKTVLERQEVLLLKLEELNKEAAQVKFLTKRG